MLGLHAVAPAQVGVHHVALDGSRAHDRHLDDEVVEAARLQARQHVHLRTALDLEHADRIGAGTACRRRPRPRAAAMASVRLVPLVLLDEIEGLADAGEHAERQHVDLQEPERVDVVLVPLDEGAVLHGRVADGHDLDQRPARQHEAADVLGEVAREAHQLVRQFEHGREQRIGRVEARVAHMLFGRARRRSSCPRPCRRARRRCPPIGPWPCRRRARPSVRGRR